MTDLVGPGSPRESEREGDEMRQVEILPLGLVGVLHVPQAAYALVAFAHGSGSSRFSPRNTAVASALNRHRFATLLFDLLTPAEEDNRANVFDIALLADRLIDAVHWLEGEESVAKIPVGLFGASTRPGLPGFRSLAPRRPTCQSRAIASALKSEPYCARPRRD